MGPAHLHTDQRGPAARPGPTSPATVFFLPTVPFHQLQWAPLGMEAPLSGTLEAGWRASSPVGWLSEPCEAGWRASSLVGSGCDGYGSATNSTPDTMRCAGRGYLL